MKTWFIAALVALVCTQADAQRIADISGLGGIGCAEYLEDRRAANKTQDALYGTWAWGYLSGYNHFSSHKEVDIPTIPTILAYLDKYCRVNPLEKVVVGAITLIGDLGGWRRR
ncbi:MAG: hypothetical protein JNN18_20870 [Rubrivivax sp.]|nr:hypothetical protein [Rubrivivax sp.]